MKKLFSVLFSFAFLLTPFAMAIPAQAVVVPPAVCVPYSVDIVSDTTDQVGGGNAVAAWDLNPGWTASIPGATWIWDTFQVVDPNIDETKTFSKTFSLPGVPTSATLDVAADNSYKVSLNAGTDVFVGPDSYSFLDHNFTSTGQDAYNPLAYLVNGSNTISFEVTNLGLVPSTYAINPAGLLYKLHVEGTQCPPVANAGPDQTLTLPTSSTTLDGSASSDSDGTIVSYVWSYVSGPITIDPADTVNPSIAGLILAGDYEYELTVTDNTGLTSTDKVRITVNSKPPFIAPVANAGPDQTLTLPTSSTTLDGSASTDPDGTITSYVWTFVSGPTTVDPDDVVAPNISGLSNGTYEFMLTVTDNDGLTATDKVLIEVKKKSIVGSGGPHGGSRPQCSDGKDNDGDGLIDITDPGCHTDRNAANPATYVPSDNEEFNGDVLGESKTAAGICTAVETYMRVGHKNDKVQVTILQNFLNDYMKAGLKVDGNYGPKTAEAVGEFQVKQAKNILTPWGLTKPTKIFYKTSLVEAKRIMCPNTYGNLPIPTDLINWSKNPKETPPPLAVQIPLSPNYYGI